MEECARRWGTDPNGPAAAAEDQATPLLARGDSGFLTSTATSSGQSSTPPTSAWPMEQVYL